MLVEEGKVVPAKGFHNFVATRCLVKINAACCVDWPYSPSLKPVNLPKIVQSSMDEVKDRPVGSSFALVKNSERNSGVSVSDDLAQFPMS